MSEIQVNKEHIAYCFENLEAHFDNKKVQTRNFKNIKCPLFVTWHIKNKYNDDYDLKGCIGTFKDMDIEKGLKEYTKISALKDTRFTPTTKSDLPNLKCAVSLLVKFEPCKDLFDWEIGVHGTTLDYEYYSGTFLPEVCSEQGWTKEECISNLLRKAGVNSGEITDKIKNRAKLTRYQSSKIEMTFDEYLVWKTEQLNLNNK